VRDEQQRPPSAAEPHWPIYGSGKKRFAAVQDVNLTVSEGEFVALLGPSGCGKSTLLRIITGLQQPTEGQVLYRGVPLRGVNPYASIVFQTFALFPWLTVLENVEVALQSRGVPPSLRTPGHWIYLTEWGWMVSRRPTQESSRGHATEGCFLKGHGDGARAAVPG